MQRAEFLHAVGERVADYANPETPSGPNDEVLNHVGQAETVVLIGPSGIGKNEQKRRLVQAVSRLGGELAIEETPSVTSRGRRSKEMGPDGFDPYMEHYDIETRAGQDAVMDLFDGGLLVQGTMHDETGEFYGSLKDAYVLSDETTRVINIADYMAPEFVRLVKAEIFRSLRGIYLVAADNEQWLSMWEGRDDDDALAEDSIEERIDYVNSIITRLVEGRSSLGLCLRERDILRGCLSFVAVDYSDLRNPRTKMTKTTETLFGIATGTTTYDDTDAADCGKIQLGFMQASTLFRRREIEQLEKQAVLLAS